MSFSTTYTFWKVCFRMKVNVIKMRAMYLSSFILVLLWNTFNGSSSMDVLLTSRYSSHGRFWNDSLVRSSENAFKLSLSFTLQFICHHYKLRKITPQCRLIKFQFLSAEAYSLVFPHYLNVNVWGSHIPKEPFMQPDPTHIYCKVLSQWLCTNDWSMVLSLTFCYSHYMCNLQEEIEFEYK